MKGKAPFVCFSHGKESGPWGTKIAAMAELARDRGLALESLDYRGVDDPAARVAKLVAYGAAIDRPLVLVGSSMGGHVAASASAQLPDVRGLFLIAPAFYMPGYEALTPEPVAGRITIVHGWRDEVVPAANSIRFAAQHRAGLHLIDGDHRLTGHIFEINRFFDWFLDDVTS
jgi:pimeloyl-ACP methyl ester carboxylesterase